MDKINIVLTIYFNKLTAHIIIHYTKIYTTIYTAHYNSTTYSNCQKQKTQ